MKRAFIVFSTSEIFASRGRRAFLVGGKRSTKLREAELAFFVDFVLFVDRSCPKAATRVPAVCRTSRDRRLLPQAQDFP